jgi:hypothetical protein
MIPKITPNYFKSRACRQELLDFYAKCKARDVPDLILPVMFSGASSVNVDSSDEVVRIVAGAQYEDFSEDPAKYRNALVRMTEAVSRPAKDFENLRLWHSKRFPMLILKYPQYF